MESASQYEDVLLELRRRRMWKLSAPEFSKPRNHTIVCGPPEEWEDHGRYEFIAGMISDAS